VTRKLDLGPKARAVKEWVDLAGYACGKAAKGLVPLAAGSFAGIEAFAPTLLPAVEMSHDTAMLIFAASAAALVPGFNLGGARQHG
jgi:hypothetical protein